MTGRFTADTTLVTMQPRDRTRVCQRLVDDDLLAIGVGPPIAARNGRRHASGGRYQSGFWGRPRSRGADSRERIEMRSAGGIG